MNPVDWGELFLVCIFTCVVYITPNDDIIRTEK